MRAHPITTASSQAPANQAPNRTNPLARVAAVWVACAVLVSASGALLLAPWLTPLCIVGLVAGTVAAYHRSPAFRSSADRLDLRVIVALHALRAPIGAAFLFEAARGQLAPLFAERAGYGDIAAGLLALLVLPALARRTPNRRRLLLAWNTFAFADILMAFATAQYLLVWRGDALMQGAITRLPYPLLPTLVVPWVVLTHLLVFARLRAEARS